MQLMWIAIMTPIYPQPLQYMRIDGNDFNRFYPDPISLLLVSSDCLTEYSQLFLCHFEMKITLEESNLWYQLQQ